MEKCKCLTSKGSRCSRLGKAEYKGYCFQHKNCKTPVSTKLSIKKPIVKKRSTKVDENKKALRKLAKIEELGKRIAAQQLATYKPKPLPKPVKKVKNPDLNRDAALVLFMHMDPKTIIKVCSASKYNQICDNKFWRMRLRQDFHIDSKRKEAASEVYRKVAQFYYNIEKKFDTEISKSGSYSASIRRDTAHYFMSEKQADSLFKSAPIPIIMIHISNSDRHIGKYIIYKNLFFKDGVSKENVLEALLLINLPKKKDGEYKL